MGYSGYRLVQGVFQEWENFACTPLHPMMIIHDHPILLCNTQEVLPRKLT